MDEYALFMCHVDVRGPNECWPWKGTRRGGPVGATYGRFRLHGKTYTAHRWLLGYLRGKPLIDKPVGTEDGCHRCDNPPCCNPAHLYVGTRKENIADAVERTRIWQLKVTHCPQGHEYTSNPSGKHRRCRECENAALRNARMDARTHCKNGHQLDGDNVLLCKNGTRKCRICDEARLAASIATRRRKAAA
jgi:hypothetical protein